MKNTLLLLYTILVVNCSGQEMPASALRFVEESRLEGKVTDFGEYENFDFSTIWSQSQDATIGFIGPNYQRLYIRLISIIKNQNDKNSYYVYGKSRVKNNICEFQGEIRIVSISEFDNIEKEVLYKEALKHGDKEAAERFAKERKLVLAEYIFFENPNQSGSGLFRGILKSYFYMQNEAIHLDNLDIEASDSYKNNQCVGIWESYKTGSQKQCNWGNYRIPYSNDLDIGVGEFSPNEKFLNNGWNSYYKANFTSDGNAKKEEKNKWWLIAR